MARRAASLGSGLIAPCWLLAAALAAADGGLPPEPCVRLQREARVARMGGDPAAELRKLEQARRECPGDLVFVYALLDFHRRQPGHEESYREFLAELRRRLRDPEVELPAGIVDYLVRHLEIGDDELRAILDRISRQLAGAAEPDPGLARIQAQLQQRLGHPEAALETLERLWRGDGPEDLFWPLLSLYSRLGRWQDAARLLAPRAAEDPVLRRRYVHVLGKLGRYREALEEVRKIAPAAAGAGTDAGGTAATGEAVIGAIDFDREPELHVLLEQLAWNLRDGGRDAEAEEVFRALAARIPDDVELQATVLHLYAGEEERRDRAEEVARTWESETDADVLFEEGTQRLTAGDAAGAIDLLRRAAPGLPDLEAAWYNLGMAAYRLEDWATVESAFGRAAEIHPERAQSFFFRGIALEKLGRCGEAVAALEHALELDPDRALAHYYLASCYRELGDGAAAAAALSRYRAAQGE